MNRLVVTASGLGLFVGLVLVFAELAWFRRVPLVERLRPHVRSGATTTASSGVLSVESIRDVLRPLAASLGAQVSKSLGVGDDLAARLTRAGDPTPPAEFRLRQFTTALCSMLGVGAVSIVVGPPAAVSVAAPLAAFALGYLVVEQRLASASAAWQQRVTLELPVVIEQLGMLLSSGHSLSGAVARIGQRGRGECAAGFRQVTLRVGQGLSEVDALRELAATADVAALDRLVGVLALNREASDLGALIAGESRLVRREVHRELIETIERRSQTVWIPVTVATLVPGVIFMAVPFVDAMRQLTG